MPQPCGIGSGATMSIDGTAGPWGSDALCCSLMSNILRYEERGLQRECAEKWAILQQLWPPSNK